METSVRPESHTEAAAPRPTLSLVDAVALIVGIVIGAGIFRTPSLVAANTDGLAWFVIAWALGGLISLIGALCYAELASAYPNAGGDYHFITRAFGPDIAFLFAWARLMVIQTGSIALLAFVFGDYAAQVLPLGSYAPALYAAAAILLLTLIQWMNVHQGTGVQKVLVAVKLLGFAAVIGLGLFAPVAPASAPPAAAGGGGSNPAFGMAMIFVLLTFGGWNEAAYLSAEIRDGRRTMSRALLGGIGIITLVYLLVNLAYYRGLGLAGMSGSEAVAADLMRATPAGEAGARAISFLVAIAALGSTNATLFTGARTAYALGRDFSLFGFLGRWQERSQVPANALLVQAGIALALVAYGATTSRSGFQTMVDYTAPVFWFFFLLAGLSLFVLRAREPETPRPFRTPLYPLTPLVFCAVTVYMLNSSLSYAGAGTWVGVGVLIVGMPLLLFARPRASREPLGTDTVPALNTERKS